METVENYPQRRMVSLAHQVPNLLIGIDVTAPGQGFVADAQAALASMLGQQAQVVHQ
ncbi:hypothetical protein D3C81_2071270 [compost metagenome]